MVLFICMKFIKLRNFKFANIYKSTSMQIFKRYTSATFLCLVLLFLPLSATAQIELWTVGTAKTIPANKLEISIFRPARFGITKSIEVSAQPWAMIHCPNAQLKKNWLDRKKISIATVHALNLPKGALNALRKRDKEGYIPKDSIVPGILTIRNEVIFSTILKPKTTCAPENYLLSLKIGYHFASTWGKSTLPHIEKPIFYPRTEIYHDKSLFNVGLDLDARFNHFINYCIDVDYFHIKGEEVKDWALEHKGIVMMKLTSSVMVLAGYKLAYTTVDDEDEAKLAAYPFVDISWVYKFRKKKKLDLFGRKHP